MLCSSNSLARTSDVVAELRERVKAGGLDRELIVEFGQPLALDLGDGHVEVASLPARCSAYSSGKVTSTVRSSPATRADELLLEAGDQAS